MARRATDQAYELVRAHRYREALVVQSDALATLEGSGDAYEGNAYFNLGTASLRLGRCDDALTYLDRAVNASGASPAQVTTRQAALSDATALCAPVPAADDQQSQRTEPATNVRANFQGGFQTGDGSVRCFLDAEHVQCLAIASRTAFELATPSGVVSPIDAPTGPVGGTRTRRALLNTSETILCTATATQATCLLVDPADPEVNEPTGFALSSDLADAVQNGVSLDPSGDTASLAPTIDQLAAPTNVEVPTQANQSQGSGSEIPGALPSDGYGQISPATGLPRTTYVRPYDRADGTHVSGYYRSCSRCGP